MEEQQKKKEDISVNTYHNQIYRSIIARFINAALNWAFQWSITAGLWQEEYHVIVQVEDSSKCHYSDIACICCVYKKIDSTPFYFF